MKKIKSIIFPILCGMFLSACSGNAPSKVQKATINIEENQYMTTSLKAGEYQLNKAITFTVSPINEEYSVSSVKMDETELPPSNANQYTFTPVEAKTYTLKVTTQNLKNKVVLTFNGLTEDNYVQKLERKGTRISAENYVSSAGFENVFKNDKFYVANDKMFRFLCRIDEQGEYNVWIRKIEFTFADNKSGLELMYPDETESYSNGVWSTTRTKGNQGTSEIMFKGVEEAIISKVVITTAPFEEEKLTLEFNGLDNNDRVYYFAGGASIEMWENRKPLLVGTEFHTLQTYYLYVEYSQDHKSFYDGLNLIYGETTLQYTNLFKDEQKYVVYTFSPLEGEIGKRTIKCDWLPKDATDNFKIDDTTAIKYVKGYMETNPLATLGINSVNFGEEVSLSLKAKKGYMDLKMFVNDTEASFDEVSRTFKFKVPLAKDINVRFSATEGEEHHKGRTIVALKGENEDKGILLAGSFESNFYVAFENSEDHPTAKITSLSFKGNELPKIEFEENLIFSLNADQEDEFKKAEDKASLFNAVITEDPSYTSALKFNKGSFKVEIAGSEVSESYDVTGRSNVTVKFIPNENLDIYAIEVNDRRLKDNEYVINPDGSISYSFTANAELYEFLVQTKAQLVKLALDESSTTGYIIKDLPANPVECGVALRLTLGVTDESEYSLYEKKITVTYNGANVPVDLNDFTFTIIPVRTATLIKVVVEPLS